ncbi:hypothetical protein [Streptomyces griseorubiginosus]|uniref:hypothetical protein n=1 Tax=Streptomyces griseorubiginosus TaxID=67304 RepID=UPI001B8007C3
MHDQADGEAEEGLILGTSFLPGRVFTSPADFNIQLADWLTRASRRIHRTLQARPADRLEADRSRMLVLPPIATPGWWKASLRLPQRAQPPRIKTSEPTKICDLGDRRLSKRRDTPSESASNEHQDVSPSRLTNSRQSAPHPCAAA